MRRNAIACLILCLCLVCLAVSLIGCSDSTRTFEDRVKVIYQLEGGIYQNCEQPVIQYYDFEGEGGHLIKELSSFSKQEIIRTGYSLEGWYTKKVVDGDSVTYENKWDFEKDKVDADGVTLYAKWKKNIIYATVTRRISRFTLSAAMR